mmetsp:Transcript_29284/g.59045  ORF Transcript_29284/g.59045 Transcript_29284/m.59045 type:complete len:279 (-) Transcript_29284:867-1703(-)
MIVTVLVWLRLVRVRWLLSVHHIAISANIGTRVRNFPCRSSRVTKGRRGVSHGILLIGDVNLLLLMSLLLFWLLLLQLLLRLLRTISTGHSGHGHPRWQGVKIILNVHRCGFLSTCTIVLGSRTCDGGIGVHGRTGLGAVVALSTAGEIEIGRETHWISLLGHGVLVEEALLLLLLLLKHHVVVSVVVLRVMMLVISGAWHGHRGRWHGQGDGVVRSSKCDLCGFGLAGLDFANFSHHADAAGSPRDGIEERECDILIGKGDEAKSPRSFRPPIDKHH